MREVNEFVINFIGWMIAVAITGTIHLELIRSRSDAFYWVSKILFFVVLIGGPIMCIVNL